MNCPACQREQPMSFRCRFCGHEFSRQYVPSRSGAPRTPAPPRATPSVPPLNPYAAPAVRTDRYPGPPSVPAAGATADEAPLADPGKRLVAQLLDGLLGLGCMGPGLILVIAAGPEKESSGAQAASIVGGLLLVAGLIGLLVYQIRLLAREGQTWGKMKMNIRIVLYDTGEVPGLGRSLGLRLFVNNLIGAIPCVGGIYSIVDILFIFGEEHRCLHDRIAGTKVVVAA